MGHNKERHSEHKPAKEAVNFIDPVIWDTYTKFGFIRHPYEWVVSMWYMKSTLFYGENTDVSLSEFVRNLKLGMFKHWFLDDDGKMLVDDVYRLEDIFDVLKSEFGIKPVHINKTINKLPNLLTDRDKLIIREKFPHEFEYYK